MQTKTSNRFYWTIGGLLCLFAIVGGMFAAQWSVSTAFAQTDPNLKVLQEAGTAFTKDAGGIASRPPPLQLTIFRVLRLVLGMIGTVFFIIILYGGFLWFSAGGSPEKVGDAKKTIVRAIVGMIVISASYAIVSFLFQSADFKEDKNYSVGDVPGALLDRGADKVLNDTPFLESNRN